MAENDNGKNHTDTDGFDGSGSKDGIGRRIARFDRRQALKIGGGLVGISGLPLTSTTATGQDTVPPDPSECDPTDRESVVTFVNGLEAVSEEEAEEVWFDLTAAQVDACNRALTSSEVVVDDNDKWTGATIDTQVVPETNLEATSVYQASSLRTASRVGTAVGRVATGPVYRYSHRASWAYNGRRVSNVRSVISNVNAGGLWWKFNRTVVSRKDVRDSYFWAYKTGSFSYCPPAAGCIRNVNPFVNILGDGVGNSRVRKRAPI